MVLVPSCSWELGGLISSAEWMPCSVTDVSDLDDIFGNSEKDQIVAEGHHPPSLREWVCRVSFWKCVERFAGVEQAGKEVARGIFVATLFDDVVPNRGEVAVCSGRVSDPENHAMPSFALI
jgi:hypothetical protein